MSTDSMKSSSNGHEKPSSSSSSSLEDQEKINEVRRSLGPLTGNLSVYCSDASIARHLRARNWNVKKAIKMVKETLKWRSQYKPEEIRWEEVAKEAETGKIYRLSCADKHGRSVLVMRPACENSKSTKGKIRYLVYCMENAILNLPADQEQMVWLIDFHGYTMSNISLNVTRETSIVLQNHYPERLGVAILYNPPKFFEPFWMVAKPFLEPKTQNKVKFVYSDDHNTKKIMEDLFDMDSLESSFGGNNPVAFDIKEYAERMREDDKRMPSFWARGTTPVIVQPITEPVACPDPVNSRPDSNETDIEQAGNSSSQEAESEPVLPENSLPETHESSSSAGEVHSAEVITNNNRELNQVSELEIKDLALQISDQKV